EQPPSQDHSNPYRRSTLPDCSARILPISFLQEYFILRARLCRMGVSVSGAHPPPPFSMGTCTTLLGKTWLPALWPMHHCRQDRNRGKLRPPRGPRVSNE